MKIHFWGAAQTVTGSAHYIEVNGSKILLECGLYQGKRKLANQLNTEFRFPPSSIDAVVVSHAHIDHTGNLPNLVKQGYEGPIYAQRATADLSQIMIRDAGHIQEADVRFINERRAKRDEPPIDPLYTLEEAAAACNLLVERDYKQPFEVAPGVLTTYVEAGHILGSTAIILDIDDHGKKIRLWFSGDIGRSNLPILRDPVLPYDYDVDYMIMECTYGDRPHSTPEEAHEELRSAVQKVIGRGGKVIIPAFAVGRTQELVYSLNRLMMSGDIPRVPVYVDSPLAVNASDIFRAHPECFDEEARQMLKSGKHRTALGFDMLTYVRSVEESKALNSRTDPMIIISASGMVEVGRILHHLRNNIHDPRSGVLIVSWMAPETLGRRLVEGAEQVKIYGEVFDRKIEVFNLRGFSAHAGQDALKEYALAVHGKAKEVFLVHGEQRGADGLRGVLDEAGMHGLHFPERGTTFEV
jgi:metallo-beta-lactamase family protein